MNQPPSPRLKRGSPSLDSFTDRIVYHLGTPFRIWWIFTRVIFVTLLSPLKKRVLGFQPVLERQLLSPFLVFGASLIAQYVKNLPAKQETLVRFLSWENPLEKG